LRARQIAQLSGYGAPPQKLLKTVPYFVRVFLRKRQLQVQLRAQLQQRKRTEQKAEDALCAMGEALYAQRSDPRMATIAAQLRLVSDAREQITSNTAAGKRTAQTRIREFELQARKLEAEQKALRGSTQVAALEQIAALETQLEGLRGAIQSLNVELLPLSEDLGRAKNTLAKHMDALEQAEELQRKTIEASERDADRQRIAAGAAVSAYRETLRSLANAAIRNQLSDLAAPAMANAAAAEAPIADERHSEELLRKAVNSYDEVAYRRGVQLLASSILGTLLFFVLLIVF
jgi:hypothetical protein